MCALVEQLACDTGLFGIERHLLHDSIGECNFIFADASVDLGDMAHNRERRGKKSRLYAFLARRPASHCRIVLCNAFIEVVPERRAKHRAEWTAQHEAESPTDNFTPPSHVRLHREPRGAYCARVWHSDKLGCVT